MTFFGAMFRLLHSPFPESYSIASRCMTNLKPVLQVEAPGQVNRLFSTRTPGEEHFNLLLCSALGLPRTLSLSVTVLWTQECKPPSPLTTKTRQSRRVPCVVCTCPPAFNRALNKHRNHEPLLVLARQRKTVFVFIHTNSDGFKGTWYDLSRKQSST